MDNTIYLLYTLGTYHTVKECVGVCRFMYLHNFFLRVSSHSFFPEKRREEKNITVSLKLSKLSLDFLHVALFLISKNILSKTHLHIHLKLKDGNKMRVDVVSVFLFPLLSLSTLRKMLHTFHLPLQNPSHKELIL